MDRRAFLGGIAIATLGAPRVAGTNTFDRTAGSHSLAAAEQREC